MSSNLIITCILVALVAAVVVAWYLGKSVRFSKGNYGKKTVKSVLRRYAATHNFKLLENVEMELDSSSQTIDFVLVGFFGLIFVSALQGKGDFYGDFKEEKWTFVDEEQRIRFNNPVIEMDKKLEMFRRIIAQKKVYNLKVDTAIVVVSTKTDVPMYLSNVRENNPVMNVEQFRKMLGNEKYELDNNVDMDTVCKVLRELKGN